MNEDQRGRANNGDLKIINLSGFQLQDISLLKRGLSFSPNTMSEFEVFKDLNLFLRKIFYRTFFEDSTKTESSVGDIMSTHGDPLVILWNSWKRRWTPVLKVVTKMMGKNGGEM